MLHPETGKMLLGQIADPPPGRMLGYPENPLQVTERFHADHGILAWALGFSPMGVVEALAL